MVTREGIIGQSINLGIKFYQNGELYDPYNVSDVLIYDAESGGTLIATVPCSRISEGYYVAAWAIPSSMSPTTLYDSHAWVAESGMTSKTQTYSFDIVPNSVSVDVPSFVRADVACRSRPSWTFYVGLRTVEDVGNGMGQRLTWGEALPASTANLVHYNIYYSSSRFGVFSSWPQAITTTTQVVVNVPPGQLYHFAVRATEFDTDEFNLEELTQIGTDLYQYPDTLVLQSSIDAYGASIEVGDTTGYPDKGFLIIDTEVILYSSKTATYFAVEDIDRGAISTPIATHEAGAEVKLWHGVEDQNTYIFSSTAAWHFSNGIPHNADAIGEYAADEDGYRAISVEVLTTDLSASDANTEDFPSYDYTGYRRSSPQSLFSGQCVGTYVGGEFNGGRGLNLQDQSLSRLTVQLELVGEPLVLLKRKWTGKKCRCVGLRNDHPHSRCEYCFGTSFDGGFNRYINTRPISELYANTQGYILARVYPYVDDLELDASQSLRQTAELQAWTINIPTLRDRDVLVRFSEDGTEEFRYECLNVTRNKLFFSQTGKQEFTMKRLDKTDAVYTFSIDLL